MDNKDDQIIDLKFANLEQEIRHDIDGVTHKLGKHTKILEDILAQTKRTNGRVTKLESVDDSYATYKFLVGHKKYMFYAAITFAYAFSIEEFRDMLFSIIPLG